MKNKILSLIVTVALVGALFSGCAEESNTSSGSAMINEASVSENSESIQSVDVDSGNLVFDNSSWSYNADDNIYWQIGIVYCENPEDVAYESMGIYVPAAYMTATDNGDGTYTCEINTEGTVNGYTALTAPMVMPVNTPGYAAMSAPTEYTTGLESYLDAGFIYVFAGARGRMGGMGGAGGPNRAGGTLDEAPENTEVSEAEIAEPEIETSVTTSDVSEISGGAPWGVTDLKAAIRYLRYNASILPGNTDKIITFGMSGGGAQSALVGATGDSSLYTPYLESIGAAMTDSDGNPLSDATFGTMAWCPITSLDYADEAYEWNMGQYTTTGTRADGTFTKELSDDMAVAYALYVNELGLVGADGTILLLEATESGIYSEGSYYEYMLSIVEDSLNNFLEDTTFPYTPDNSFRAGFAGNAGGNDGATKTSTETISYATVGDYIDYLNTDEVWVTYDAATNKATISSMSAFVAICKKTTKDVGAFDSLSLSAGENEVFGTTENEPLHFDSVMAGLLSENAEAYSAYTNWNAAYVSDYNDNLGYVDELGSSTQQRQNAYNPMYYLSSYYEGYGTSTVAPNWRIRTGINQGDTALTVETNLALALEQYEGVSDVDFETVWGLQHTTAERTGDATTNFVAWVNKISR